MQAGHDTLLVTEKPALIRLTTEDWLIWRSLRLQALTEAPYAYSSKLADWQGEGDLETRWRDRLASVPFNLLAVLNQFPVGMVSASEPDGDGIVELFSLWVAPMGRGRGVGNALVEAVVLWARDCGAQLVSLNVKEGNVRAMELYLRYGFVDMGVVAQPSAEDTLERRFLKKMDTSR
jgi:ribosomal protein S18 acetylase RimI-like enzyme